MKKLIQGIVAFQKNLTEKDRKHFAKLSLGQKPDVLFIACSDSRVVPNLFASTDPGDLFVIRNVGNLVPPKGEEAEESVAAALEFSLHSLEVKDIIVCGHSECAAMQTILQGKNLDKEPHLEGWLCHGHPSLERMQKKGLDTSLSRVNQLSQSNVLQQMQHLQSYPFVQELLKDKKLRIHGWWFDIATADVYAFEEKEGKFVLIDEKEAEVLLQKLS